MAQPLVGLDIGHRTVRAVSLRRVRGVLHVQAWAAVPRCDDEGHERPLDAVLGDIKQRIDLGGAPVVAISTVASLVRYVSTVALPPDRLAKSLRLELMQNMEGATELAADTFTLPLPGDELKHCCVLAQPGQVRETLEAFTLAKVPVGSLHYAPAALLNTSLVAPPVEGKDLCLVVDIGAQTTSVGLLGEGRLLACRQLPSGGQHFTDTLASARGITPTLAETWKVSGQLPAAPSSAATSSSILPPAGMVPAKPLSAPSAATTIPVPTPAGGDLFDDGPLESPALVSTPVTKPLLDPNALFEDTPPPSPVLPPATPVASTPPATPEPSPAIAALFEDTPASAALEPAPTPAPAVFDPFKAEPEHLPPPPPGRSTMMMARAELGPEMTKAAEMLYAQLASSIAWFKTQLDLPDLPIAQVRIAGGGAGLTALDAYLVRRFGVPVQRLDPFLGLQGDAPERPHEFAAAVGLALAAPGGHKDAIHLELLPEGLLRQRLWTTSLVWPFVAAAAVLLAGAVTTWSWWSEQDFAAGEKRRIDTYLNEHKKRMGQITRLRQEREELGEDLRAIASRIYAARDLLFTVRALKEQTGRSKELWATHLETKDVGIDTSAPTAGAVVAANDPRRAKPKNRADDTAIDRGGVVIAGFVKFDGNKLDTEMNAFFDQWRQAILDWRSEAGTPRLFKDLRVNRFDVKHLKDNKDPKVVKDGRVPFEVSYSYQATQLSQLTETADGTAPSTPAPTPEAAP